MEVVEDHRLIATVGAVDADSAGVRHGGRPAGSPIDEQVTGGRLGQEHVFARGQVDADEPSIGEGAGSGELGQPVLGFIDAAEPRGRSRGLEARREGQGATRQRHQGRQRMRATGASSSGLRPGRFIDGGRRGGVWHGGSHRAFSNPRAKAGPWRMLGLERVAGDEGVRGDTGGASLVTRGALVRHRGGAGYEVLLRSSQRAGTLAEVGCLLSAGWSPGTPPAG